MRVKPLHGAMRALVLCVTAACCTTSPAQSPPPVPIPARPIDPAIALDVDAAIATLWPDGCFTLRDAAGVLHTSNRDRCALPRRPYSTFKLANALIAVDAGILDGPDAAMTWDKRTIPDEKSIRDAWRTPHTLRTGLAVSAVPYFRTLARQLGEPRMRAGLAKLDYGNQDISGGLDRFWLGGGMRISAAQQLELMEGLARGKLAVSARAQEVVREISELERTATAVLHGKTGSGPIEDETGGWVVWQVGWIERGSTMIPYACWLETKTEDVDAARAAREQRLRATLAALELFP